MLPDIGSVLAGQIVRMCKTGRFDLLERLEKSTPPDLVSLSDLPGLGPKRLRVLEEVLGVRSVTALRRACEKGEVRSLPRFGEGLQRRLLQAIEDRSPSRARRLQLLRRAVTPT